MSDAPIRVVFDCNTLLQAFASPNGPAGKCVQLAINGDVSLFISSTVLDELRDVTSRPRLMAKLALVDKRVAEFVERLSIAATLLADFPEIFRYSRDPDDAHYVNLALAAGAKLVVSRDKDLLDLMTAVAPEALQLSSGLS